MRFRSLLAVCAIPLAVTGAVYGCSSEPPPEDLCGWLQNPDGTNCVAEFHEDIKDKCGAPDFASVSGVFGKRAALDMCVLTSKGGSVVFDPPIDITKFPGDVATTMKVINGDGSPCGEISYLSQFSWSLKISPPPAVSGAGGTSSTATSSATTGQGGSSEEQGEAHYTQGIIAVTNVRDQTIQVSCPAPDVLLPGVIVGPETHFYNMNQVLAATQSNGCPQFAQIIPQAILELDPGGVQRSGSLRLKIQYPPESKAAGTSGTGSSSATASSSTGGTIATVAPELVYYFDCTIPEAPLVCANGIQDGSEVDVDCGGPETTPGCPVRCGVGQLCSTDCDCDPSSLCLVDAMSGTRKCTAVDGGAPMKAACSGIICSNQVKDTSETDVDCGGLCPTKCPDGQHCAVNGDCAGNSCTLKVCGPPTCKDGAANGVETDVDCGGGTCPTCKDGQKCAAPSDCASGGCSMTTNLCTQCANTKQDGNETDIDCGGGGACAPCGDAKNCKQNSDCVNNICNGGKCNGCSNGQKDGKESDKDCGGPDCKPCADGKTCTAATDCTSNGCLNGLCSPCADGMQDGSETDKDCGGGTCPKCANGLVCATTADCADGTCQGFRCGSCTDMIKDGDESDVDCGGTSATCTRCPEAKACFTDGDCAHNVCHQPDSQPDGGPVMPGVCNTCLNGVVDPSNETDVDCGGKTCPKCAVTKSCAVNLDCVSGICIGGKCK